MVRRLSLACGLLSFGLTPAAAAEICTATTANPWLRQGSSSAPLQKLEADRVRLVTAHVPEAIAKLADRSAAMLSGAEVRKFTGDAHPFRDRLQPYLVRAVYPSGYPVFDLRWDGRRLDVFGGGLGCAPFTKHPIVVFLERQPRDVYVMASAAL